MYDSKDIAEVRRLLYALAQATDTPLPEADVQVLYVRLLLDEARGVYGVRLVKYAVEYVIKQWRYPSFPKPADIIAAMRIVRTDPAFVQEISEERESHLIEETSKGDPREEERVRSILREWREEGGSDFAELTRRLEER